MKGRKGREINRLVKIEMDFWHTSPQFLPWGNDLQYIQDPFAAYFPDIPGDLLLDARTSALLYSPSWLLGRNDDRLRKRTMFTVAADWEASKFEIWCPRPRLADRLA